MMRHSGLKREKGVMEGINDKKESEGTKKREKNSKKG